MPQHIRVSTGLLDEMHGFIAALNEILTHGCPERETLHTFGLAGVYPNPFSSHCRIRVSSSGTEKTLLAIYDSSGRKVRTLLNGFLKTGSHQIHWDGRDVHGRSVASGVYIVNLLQGEFAASKKVTVLR